MVDDDDSVRHMLRRLIETRCNFDVVAEASDGEQALVLVEELKPDVVVTDIQMPRMDGAELTRRIKEMFPWVHVLAVTGLPNAENERRMREAGASGFIDKVEGKVVVFALGVTAEIGPDRRRGERSRCINAIWDAAVQG